MRKKLAIVMALLAGALMVPNQEVLARGSGGGGHQVYQPQQNHDFSLEYGFLRH